MQRLLRVLLSAGAIAALTACGGGNSNSSSSTTTTTAASPAASPSAAAASMKSASMKSGSMKSANGKMAATKNGQAVYTTNCQSCHQANGQGQPGAFPPLAGNAVVTGDASKVIHIVKNGLVGKIAVGSSTYNGNMPAWKGSLSNADIAAVITYVRSAWGNKGSAVTTAQVAATK